MKQNEVIQEGPIISGIMNKLKGGTYTAGAERERGNQEINRQLKMAEPSWHKYQAALTAGGTTDAEMPDQITDWARRHFSQDSQNPLMTIPDYASKFPGPLNDQNVRDYIKLAAAKYMTRGGPRPATNTRTTNPTNTTPASTTPTRVNYGGTSGTATSPSPATLPQATPVQGAYSVRTPGQTAAPAAPAAAPAAEPQGQALDLDQYKRDKAARLAAAQADQQQAQQQIAATAQANAQTAAADNAKVAEVQAIKDKQARGELLSTAEKNTLNLAAKSGIHETEYNVIRAQQILQEAKKLQKKLTAAKKARA